MDDDITMPEGYDPSPLAPVVVISDRNFRPVFRYEHPRVSDDPVQDFKLSDWSLDLGVNSNTGACFLMLEDHDGLMTAADGTCKVRPGYIVQISLGKAADGIAEWFTGTVHTPATVRPGYRTRMIDIQAVGYAATLSYRTVSMDYRQETDAAGTPIDDDQTALIPELVRRIITDDTWQVIPPVDRTITANGISDEIGIKLASLSKQLQTQESVIAELANIADAVYGITPGLDFYFRPATAHSGHVATNDPDIIKDADPAAIMILSSDEPYQYGDTTVSKAFSDLIATNVTLREERVVDGGGSTNVILSSSEEWHGFVIGDGKSATRPYRGRIPANSIFVRLGKRQNITAPLDYIISQPQIGGTVRPDTGIQQEGEISQDTINNDIPLNGSAFVLIRNSELKAVGSPTGRILWLRNNSRVQVPCRTSGISGTPADRVGYYKARTRSSSDSFADARAARFRVTDDIAATIIATNANVRRVQLPKQVVRNLSDAPASHTATSVIEGVLGRAGETRRIYRNIVVSAPDTPPDMGTRIRLADRYGKIDSNILLIGMSARANMKNRDVTAHRITLEAENIVSQ